MAFNNSPLLAMPPLTSPNGSLHRHLEAGEGSGGASQQETNSNAPNLYQIPFQATPVQHGPTPLTFGFGFSSSSASATGSPIAHATTPSTSIPWGLPSISSQSSPSHRLSPASRGSTAVSGRRNDAKRRRDSDDDDSDDDMEGGREKSASPMSYSRVIASKQALPKRMRAGIGAVGMINLDESRASSSRSSVTSMDGNAGTIGTNAHVDKVDLGKILSTLDKPSLLTLFSRLLTSSTDATLRDQIIAHIPSPSLDSVESGLDEIEKNIRNACAHSGQMRSEFAWGRLRNPVSDFVSTALGFLPFFIDDVKDGGALSSRLETPHPSTTFNFLHSLTVRTIRIMNLLPPSPTNFSASLFSSEVNKQFSFGSNVSQIVKAYQDLLPSDSLNSSNPNTMVTQLIPALLIQWSRLQEKLCKGVNEEGKMFGNEMMRGWLMSLESLGWMKRADQEQLVKMEEIALRKVLDGIRARLEQEVGWLIGLHSRGASVSSSNHNTWKPIRTAILRSSRSSTHMEEEEEL